MTDDEAPFLRARQEAGKIPDGGTQFRALVELAAASEKPEPGDVTVHFGHTLHAAHPPTSPTAARKVMYVGYHLPEAFAVVGPGQSYNDVLVGRDAGRVKSVDEVVGGR